MNFIIENWYIILAALAIVAVAIVAVSSGCPGRSR